MKYKTLYFSLLKTYLKSDVKLNIFIFLISLCSVFSFLLFNVGYKSSEYAYSSMYDRSKYGFEITDYTTNDIRFITDNFPEITFITCGKTKISYLAKDGMICKFYGCIQRFPAYFEQLHHNINPAYPIKSGRDFTKEELEKDMGKIIVDSESGFSVGDTLTLPSGNGNVELEIIGTSDNFVLPFSFFSSDKDITVYNTSKDSMFNYICKTDTFININVAFKRDLSQEETEKLYNAVNGNLEITPPSTANGGNLFFYAFSSTFVAIASVFTAIQLLTLMLHLAENCSEQLSVIKTTGCKDKYAVALLMCVNLTYVLAAFIASIVLLPLLVYFTKQLRLEYIPGFADYLISFIIFSAIMLISTLPGLKRTVRNPLRKRGG